MIDRVKERYINEMNAMTEAIKLGTELKRMDESIANIPSADKQAEWDSKNRSATIKIANSNATEKSKAAADYVLTGIAPTDTATLATVIGTFNTLGGSIMFSEGTCSVDITINTTTPIRIIGQGFSTKVIGKLTVNAGSSIDVENLSISNATSLDLNGTRHSFTNCYIDETRIDINAGIASFVNCEMYGTDGMSHYIYVADGKAILMGNVFSADYDIYVASGSTVLPSTANAIADVNDINTSQITFL